MEEAATTTAAYPPPYDPERQTRLTAEAMSAMQELVACIPRQFDFAAEPEAIFVPRRAAAVAGARRGGRR